MSKNQNLPLPSYEYHQLLYSSNDTDISNTSSAPSAPSMPSVHSQNYEEYQNYQDIAISMDPISLSNNNLPPVYSEREVDVHASCKQKEKHLNDRITILAKKVCSGVFGGIFFGMASMTFSLWAFGLTTFS